MEPGMGDVGFGVIMKNWGFGVPHFQYKMRVTTISRD
jgi:hypothetical protein